MAKLKLSAGQPFDQSALNADVLKLQDKYGAIGYVKAEVKGDLRYLDHPGQVDLVYDIHEGVRYRVGRILVEIKGENPHTQLTTVLNRLSFQPGEFIDMREVRDSERRLKFSQLYMVDPSKGYPPKITFVKPGKPDGDDKDDDTLVAEVPDQPKRHGGYRGQSPDPSPADWPTSGERTVDLVFQFDSMEGLRRAEAALGIAAPSPAAWAARGVAAPPANPNFPQYAPATRAPMPAYGTPPAAWAARGVATPPANPNVPQYAPATRPATPAYGTPLPPPSADPNWQPAAGPVPQPMTQPMVIRGQYTGDRGFAVPNLNSTDSPATGTAPNDAPAAAGDNWSAPSPASPPSPRYPPPSAQYAPVRPYAAPQQQPAYSPAVSQSSPLSSSGVTGSPWPRGGQNYMVAAPGAAPDQSPYGNQGPPPAGYQYQGAPPAGYPYQGAPPVGNQYQGAPPVGNQYQDAPPYGSQAAPMPYGYQASPPPYGYQSMPPPPNVGGFQDQLNPIFGRGSSITEPSPNGEPFLLLDPRIVAEEAQTGRIMVGVGVNSDAGLVGNIVLEEHNFDWARFPTSWEDIRNGTAWRGEGEYFRIECMPGTELQQYAVNYAQPYWFDLAGRAVSLGLGGFYNTRIFTQWTEGREGGRVSLGYQLTHDLTAGVAFIGENVNISDPVVPTPVDLERVLGNNAMYGFQVSLQHNTLDSEFMATQGHLFKLSFEEVTGSYTYPQVGLELSQYFKLSERADHTGCHVFMLRAGRAIPATTRPSTIATTPAVSIPSAASSSAASRPSIRPPASKSAATSNCSPRPSTCFRSRRTTCCGVCSSSTRGRWSRRSATGPTSSAWRPASACGSTSPPWAPPPSPWTSASRSSSRPATSPRSSASSWASITKPSGGNLPDN